MSDVVVVVPARYGSQRLPGKPLRDVGGLPLVVRVLQRLDGLAPIPVLLVTDHAGVARVAKAHGFQAVTTPRECPSGTDRVAKAVALRRESIVVNVQGDEPCVDPAGVRALIDTMRAERDLEMATLATPTADLDDYLSPDRVKVIVDARGNALYFSRRAVPWTGTIGTEPPPSLRHIGVYAYRRDVLMSLERHGPVTLERLEGLEQLRALYLGIRIRVVGVRGPWLSVDTEQDLEAVRRHFQAARPDFPEHCHGGASTRG